jgi:hypothetical protein
MAATVGVLRAAAALDAPGDSVQHEARHAEPETAMNNAARPAAASAAIARGAA